MTRSVNPQVPGSSPGRGARIQKSPAFTGWAFCISGSFGIGSALTFQPHIPLSAPPTPELPQSMPNQAWKAALTRFTI